MKQKNRIKAKYAEFSRLYHPDLNLSGLNIEDSTAIFSRGTILYKTSPRSFLSYCKEGNYIDIPNELFDLVPKFSKKEQHLKIEEASRFFSMFETSFTVNLNPIKFDNLDYLMNHLIRIFKYKYKKLFKRIRDNYTEDIKTRIFMYERLDFTVQFKFLEAWEKIYKISVLKSRSILSPDEIVQVIKRIKNVPIKYVSILFKELSEAVSEIIEDSVIV